MALGGADAPCLGRTWLLPRLLRLTAITRLIAQNVWLAFGFATVLIVLAAIGVLDL